MLAGIDIGRQDEAWRCEDIGCAAIERKRLLASPAVARDQGGAELRFWISKGPDDLQKDSSALVGAADGANSAWRLRLAERLVPSVEVASAKVIHEEEELR